MTSDRYTNIQEWLQKDLEGNLLLDPDGYPLVQDQESGGSIEDLGEAVKSLNMKLVDSIAQELLLHTWREYSNNLVDYYKALDIHNNTLSKMDTQTALLSGEFKTMPESPKWFTKEDVIKQHTLEILRLKRSEKIINLKVTTSTGKTFDADQLSILRLNTAVTKLMLEPDLQTIPWSTDDIPTGAMVNCTRDEIFEAFKLATDQFTENWEFKE